MKVSKDTVAYVTSGRYKIEVEVDSKIMDRKTKETKLQMTDIGML